jgi:putative hydrolase of the HAD superfamily
MAGWPEVREVEGVIEALEKLLGRHTLVVATNAGDSDAAQVWKALRRVGMGEYFKAVFTARELGNQKPDSAFFRQIESVLAQPPHRLVMVGDGYAGDVLGPKAAGWRAVWYNPGRQAAPGSLPLQDAEVSDMAALPEALERLGLPDYPTCLGWLEERGTPFNILAHVQLVAAAAYLLAVWLTEKGAAVDPVLAHRGGLLHDLGKIDSVRLDRERGAQGDHAAQAREMLLARGQLALAEIADRHMITADPASPRLPRTWEEKLVHFADKLVEGSQVVSLQERIAALAARYPGFAGEIEGGLAILHELEGELCARLETGPEALIRRLNEALGLGESTARPAG